jgi:pimeloyl-ACP methyl ester carboxylesterase
MNGPTEFTVVGTIADFDITERLAEIEIPVLLASGAYDEVRPSVVADMDARLPNSEHVIFEQSSHTPHIEEPERFLHVVEEFLERAEL